MSLFKGSLDSSNKFKANDDIRGIELIAVDNEPSFHVLETGDGVKWHVFINDSDEIIMSTTAPTSSNRNSIGNIVTGAGNSGANKALSNITAGGVSESLYSDADSTDDIGHSSYYWANGYIDKMYLRSDATIASGSSARLDFVGDIQVGVSGTGNDFTLFADTAGSYIKWSAAGNTNVGTLLIQDDAMFLWGDSSDITMTWVNGGGFEIEAAADDNVIKFGGSTHVDVYFYNKSSTNDMGWIADSSTLQLSGAAILQLGGSALDTLTDGFKIAFDDSDTLNIEPVTANDVVRIGETLNADFHLDGAAYDVIWDASANEYLFNDNAKLVFGGTSDDLVISSDGTLIQMTMAGGGTTSGIVVHPYAAQTTAMIHFDGATTDWDGASEVGMVHITGDTALAHAGASLLNVTHATTAPITDADGFLARFVSTGTARTNAYAVDVVVPVTQPALRLNSILNITGVTLANAAVLQVTGNDATNDVFAVDFHNEGSAGVLQLTGDDVDTPGLKIVGKASQTASMAILEGETNDFIGNADDTGMLHIIHGSTAMAHVGGTMLYVASSAQQKASAEGTLARFLATGTAQAGAVCVEIAAKSNLENALNCSAGYVRASEYRHHVTDRQATNAGATTGTIEAGMGFIQCNVTSADNADIVLLPSAVAGTIIWILNDDASYDFELTSAASDKINGGTANAASTVGEGVLVRLIAVTDELWIATQFAADGTESKLDASA